MKLLTAGLLALSSLTCAVILPSDTLKAPPGHLLENSRSCQQCHEDMGQITPRSHASARFSREGHGRQALMDPERCASCHRDRECQTCHRGRLSVKIHVPGYRYAHARDARLNTLNCALCHPVDRYCGSCHERR